jgi:hypothetical protein
VDGGGASAVGANAIAPPVGKGGAGGAGTDSTPIFGPGLPNSGVYAGGGGGGSQDMFLCYIDQVVQEE